jgi:uncharacterized surface protein with fasciclin (FAS1) repeats
MSSYPRSLLSAVAALTLLVVTSVVPSYAGNTTAKGDIVETAVSAGSFETLVTAVKAAGLVETLKGEGPFTVFAPTDEAFAKLPKAQLDALLADKEALTAVLTYHVVPGKIMSAELVNERYTTAKSVQGDEVIIDARISVRVNDANVVVADIPATNGVIHVIDSVILPPSMMSTLEARVRIASAANVQ